MPNFKKHLSREPKKVIKRRNDEHALKNVISLRMSDVEMKILERTSKTTSRSVSEIMREAFKSWQSNRRRLCLDM